MASSKSAALPIQEMQGMHAVCPKKDCPHCTPENILPKEQFEGVTVKDACPDCNHSGENWVCLKPGCRTVKCSRYVESHMVFHRMENMDHHICFSFADFSFWCYSCDSYVEHPLLDHNRFFYAQKFGDASEAEVYKIIKGSKHQEQIREEDENEDDDLPATQAPAGDQTASAEEEKKEEETKTDPAVDSLINAVKDLSVREPGEFTYDDLVQGLKDNRFKKILVLTGAGISVSAGIPDFRSPGTGIYDNLQEYNLPTPQALFEISYFLEKPEPFYKFAQNFDLTKFNATPTHYFIKMLQDKGVLWKNMTQNIDNLEQKTEMNMDDVVQCHGANRDAHCAKCGGEVDKEVLQQKIRDVEVMRCPKETCNGPVKPSIVFFGEPLPDEFREATRNIWLTVDLCLIMGTALAVTPFSTLPTMVKSGTPKVLFNMNNTKETGGQDFTEPRSNKLFVQGKCDETIRKLVADCGWADDFEAVLPACHKSSPQ